MFNKILERFGVVKCSHDPFRPTTEPARTLYDAFVMESKNREGKESEEWVKSQLPTTKVVSLSSLRH
jgi:hypothetical protein